MLNAFTFDLESVYLSISGPSANSMFSLDSIVGSSHAFPPAKLSRTLADEIHRNVTEEQRREWRRLRFACVLLHSLVVARANHDDKVNWSMFRVSTENKEATLEALIHAVARSLRRRSIQHHVWNSLGASKLMAAISASGADPSVVTARLQSEPGYDVAVASLVKEAAMHIYGDPLRSPSLAVPMGVLESLVDEVLVCLKAGADPVDSLFPYGWGMQPASL